MKSNSQSISYPSDGDAYVTDDSHIWVKDGNSWVDLGMIKGDKGDDAVTYEVVFSRRDAYVNSLGKITAGFAGILYKIVGANRTIFTGATFKIGYSDGKGGEGTSYETVSAGIDNVFTNSDNFFDTKDYSSTACNNSKSIYVDVIVNNVTVKTYHETFSFAGDKGDVGGQLEIRRHETGFAADYQYYSGTTKVGSLFFLDYVYIVNPDAESGYDVYRCIQDVIYSSIPTDFTTADFKAHWQEISTYDDAYFNYIIAKSAFIKFLQTNSVSANSIITTHESGEPYVRIEGSLIQIFGTSAMNMQIGINSDGKPVLSYYDNDGRLLWDLGPSGFKNSDIEKGQWVEFTYVSLATIYLTSTPPSEGAITSLSDAQKLFKNNTNYALTTIYVYHAPKVNGSIIGDDTNGFSQPQASDFDGKYFSVKSSSGLLTGKFTNNNGGISIYDDESNAYKKVFMDIVSGVLTSRSWSCSSYYYNAANP